MSQRRSATHEDVRIVLQDARPRAAGNEGTGEDLCLFALGRGTYGARRVHAVLARSQDPEVASVSLDLVRTLMQENDLHACQPRAYRITTTTAAETPTPAIVDQVKRDFTATAPGTRLVGDLT